MRFSRSVAVVLGAVAAVGLFASPASADTVGPIKSSCSGTKLATWNLSDGGVALGRTELWYSSVNGGQNCVITYNTLPGEVPTSVTLTVDDNRNREVDSSDRKAWDVDVYSSYAGASYLNNTDGKCVRVTGEVRNASHSLIDSFGSGWRNCG
jgi:hypothetical protein